MVNILDKPFITESKELQDIFDLYEFKLDDFQKHAIECLNKQESVLVTSSTGSGKCNRINTPIIMYDGTVKMVQDIKKYELLMGDDSTPRKVLSLTRGKEMMYKITLSNGDSFGCNESHILCLKYNVKPSLSIYNSRKSYCIRWFDYDNIKMKSKNFKFNENNKDEIKNEASKFLRDLKINEKIITISIKDYLNLSFDVKRNLLSYKVGVEFEEKEVDLDPYILGLWLGDGTSCRPEITNQESTVLKYLSKELLKYNCYLNFRSRYLYSFKSFNSRSNKILNILRKYDLLNNKHIPYIYKCNSRENRLKLLAGLIDTDGHYSKKYYEIMQKNCNLSEDIVYLARSLGFACNIKKVKKTCTNAPGGPKTGIYNRMTIFGDNLQDIPVLCPRKKGEKRLINKPALDYFFKVEKLGIDNYYGFELSDNHQYLLGNFIVTHNSLIAEEAIRLSYERGKKVIYTSPIKTLSNQKFFEYSKKFDNVGILTGDIKFNPDGQLIIMTTEILRNLLYKKNTENEKIEKTLIIDIDIENEVDFVIFDEIHYISDKDRGKVWEESIILLPKSVKLVMLSATIHKAEEFGKWIQTVREQRVNLIPKKERPIPLTHYLFCHANENDEKEQKFAEYGNKLIEIVNSKNEFNGDNYNNCLALKNQRNRSPKGARSLNFLITLLKNKRKLPALFFIFSRKKCEQYANEIECYFNTPQEQIEVEKIIDNQLHILQNTDIYKDLILNLKKNLVKGIGIHHSGLIPVFKEIVEILFSKGLIKILFATETFAVGVNMPTKTVVFTSLNKYSDDGFRSLETHEYLQMAGRAGRRGLDKTGMIVIMINMFEMLNGQNLKEIMTGKTQEMVSKFQFNYQFILKVILTKDMKLTNFVGKTLLSKELSSKSNQYHNKLKELEPSTPMESGKIFDEYYMIKNPNPDDIRPCNKVIKRQRKRAREIEKMDNFVELYDRYLKEYETFEEYNYWKKSIDYNNKLIYGNLVKIIEFLEKEGYLSFQDISFDELTENNLTIKGLICSQINECNEILFTEMLINNLFDDLEIEELISLLAIFIQERNFDENVSLSGLSKILVGRVKHIEKICDYFRESEYTSGIDLNSNWNINKNMMRYAYDWAKGNKFDDLCYDGFEGNFIKDMIKIDNIAKVLETMSEIVGNLDLMRKSSQISNYIIREFVSVDSLYVRTKTE